MGLAAAALLAALLLSCNATAAESDDRDGEHLTYGDVMGEDVEEVYAELENS